MTETQIVGQLLSVGEDVTRYVPTKGSDSRRRFRSLRLRESSEHFLNLLKQLDIQLLDDEDLQAVENLTRIVLNAVEIHLLIRYTHHDTGDCQYFADLRNRFRDALDAISDGLPVDPASRPTSDELLHSLASDLRTSSILKA